jgi:hypothetical protein
VKASSLLVSLAALCLATGCGTPSPRDAQCDAVCTAYNACPDPTDTLKSRADAYECLYYCDDVSRQQDRAKAAGNEAGQCLVEWRAYLDCWEANGAQLCDPAATVCADAGTAYEACIADRWCATLSSDPACTNDGTATTRTF